MFAGLLPDDFPPTRGVAQAPWWRAVEGATWNRPAGRQSSIDELLDHPVGHVSHDDARQYCAWAGTRLATEAEWEFAARGGLEGDVYPWGSDLEPDGVHRMNVWQGEFPSHNTVADGHYGTCAVDAFAPNGYGLHNATGNVWEWTADWFDPGYRARDRSRNPPGPPLVRIGSRRAVRICATPPIAGATGWPLGRRTRPMPPPGILPVRGRLEGEGAPASCGLAVV